MTATASRIQIRLPPALILSGSLHAALVGAFFWIAMNHSPVAPLGSAMEISMVAMPAASPAAPAVAAAPAPRVASVKAAAPDAMALPTKRKVAIAENAPAPEAPPAAAAKTAAGPVGEATGRANVAEMDRYLYELRTTLETRKTYPTLSRRLREAGEVMIEFKVKKDGSFDGVNIVKESSFARLNDAAVQLVASLGKFRPIPDGAGREMLSVKLPIRYALE